MNFPQEIFVNQNAVFGAMVCLLNVLKPFKFFVLFLLSQFQLSLYIMKIILFKTGQVFLVAV